MFEQTKRISWGSKYVFQVAISFEHSDVSHYIYLSRFQYFDNHLQGINIIYACIEDPPLSK